MRRIDFEHYKKITDEYFVPYKLTSEHMLEDLRRWYKQQKDSQRGVSFHIADVLTWNAVNLEGEWKRADNGFHFELESDAVAFKLRWCE